MGTTLVSVLVSPGGYFVANVGDSRAYLVRSGEIKCLTRDHSYVQELINEGRLAREAAQLDPRRNVISRYLGGGKNAILDFFYGSVQQGDIFLLTSDGVTMHLDDKDLLAQVAVTPDPLVLVDTIIERAIEEGGEDNATVVAVRMEELDSHQGKARTLLRRTVKDR